jgi:NitT/TauT family transport system permease protein
MSDVALPPRKRRRPFSRNKAFRRLLPWVVVAAIFLLWEVGVAAFKIESFVLPAPSAIFAAAWEWHWAILDNAWQTFIETAIGFVFAIAFGLIAGVAIGSSSLVYDGLYPALIGFNTIPKVAVVPILVIWFGIGTVPAIITAFLLSFFPILVNVATGIATVEPELKDVLRALGASRWQVITKVGLPRAMPYRSSRRQWLRTKGSAISCWWRPRVSKCRSPSPGSSSPAPWASECTRSQAWWNGA